ncbi:short chain dehydrogenase [Colletotrichum phormii]|uniref:Short chain dehydrogenase n=1 Tax=Colletotrichum phormii TaxID=359342 RepID=A0AAJ0EDS0_9PEZI|nr:short chain dehydrogenase [Colletotrichum phormii]KAK1633265.1 short chain dehydrogenase [Colletotrichum phormii]
MPAFTANDIPDLRDQVIIVTGGNVGLGFETIRQLSKHNPARIYLAARSKDKAEKAIQTLKEENPKATNITFLKLDLASFDSVKAAAADFLSKESRLDILVNNAGIMMTPEGLSTEGYEIQFGTNVMGPALFTQLLLPIIRETAKVNRETRVVMLSSAAHARAPSDIYNFDEIRTTMPHRATTQRYTISKLADLHCAKALAEREKQAKIIPVHPSMPFLYAAIFFATPLEKGALSQIWATASPDAKSGQYYGPIAKAESGSKLSQDRRLQEDVFGWIQKELKGHAETIA